MMTDDNLPQMKPQDSIIFALGEIKGQLSSLINSVEAQAAQQTAVNVANENEHASFRKHLGEHDTALALLNTEGQNVKEAKLRGYQRVSNALSLPAALGSLITLLTIHFTK